MSININELDNGMGAVCLAEVVAAKQGEAQVIKHRQHTFQVSYHSDHCGPIQKDDWVAFFHTDSGVFVLSKVRGKNGCPKIAYELLPSNTLSLAFGDWVQSISHQGRLYQGNQYYKQLITKEGDVCIYAESVTEHAGGNIHIESEHGDIAFWTKETH